MALDMQQTRANAISHLFSTIGFVSYRHVSHVKSQIADRHGFSVLTLELIEIKIPSIMNANEIAFGEVARHLVSPEQIVLTRRRAGITQAELAALARVSQGAVSRAERGANRPCSRLAVAVLDLAAGER